MMRRALAMGTLALLVCLSVQAQTVTTGGNLVVVDSNGLEVGPVLTVRETSTQIELLDTVVLIDGKPAILNLIDLGAPLEGRYFQAGSDPVNPRPLVAFKTSDCSGKPYLIGKEAPALRHLAAPANEVTQLPATKLYIWIWNGQAPQTALTIFSVLDLFGDCKPAGTVTKGYPAVKVPTPYVGPYSLEEVPLESGAPLSVPAVTPTGLALLFVLLLGGGWWILRR